METNYKLWALDSTLTWHLRDGRFASPADALAACKQRFPDGRFTSHVVESEAEFEHRGAPPNQSARNEAVVCVKHGGPPCQSARQGSSVEEKKVNA